MRASKIFCFAVSVMFAAATACAEETLIVNNVLGPEGPLYVDGNLYYVGWISNTLSKWDGKTTTVLNHTPGCGHNGLVLTKQKTFLLACTEEHGAILELDMTGKQLRRWDADKNGKPFEGGINDIVVTANGGAYATVFGPYKDLPTFVAGKILYPLEKTLADINIDSMNVWGKARDVEDTSFGFSDLDDMLAAAAKRQGRATIPNPRSEKGSIYRADNFEFSKVGLPSLYIGNKVHLLSRPENAPLRTDEFDAKDYHQVTDQVQPDWDLSGAVQDVDLLLEVGYQVANGDKFPEWKPGNEFRVKRFAPRGQ